MWFYQRILRIPWMEQESKEEILRKIASRNTLTFRNRKMELKFLGHMKKEVL